MDFTALNKVMERNADDLRTMMHAMKVNESPLDVKKADVEAALPGATSLDAVSSFIQTHSKKAHHTYFGHHFVPKTGKQGILEEDPNAALRFLLHGNGKDSGMPKPPKFAFKEESLAEGGKVPASLQTSTMEMRAEPETKKKVLNTGSVPAASVPETPNLPNFGQNPAADGTPVNEDNTESVLDKSAAVAAAVFAIALGC